jgi:hypothetical protein
MGPSEKSFSQVKAILGKLDRNIDSLRQQRTGTGTPVGGTAPQPQAAPPTAYPSPSTAPGVNAQSAAATAPPAPPRAPSPYGRATPIPPRP